MVFSAFQQPENIIKSPQRRRDPCIIPLRPRCKISSLLQTAHSPQQELQLPIRGSWHILWNHVPSQIDRHKRQTSLRVRHTLEAPTRRISKHMCLNTVGVLDNLAISLMVRHVEVLLLEGRGLEALGAVPGHVLNGDQGAVGEEQEVEQAVADDCVVSALDDAGKRAETGLD